MGGGKLKSLFKGCYTKAQGEYKVAKKVIAMHVRKCDDTANTNANAKCGCDAPSVIPVDPFPVFLLDWKYFTANARQEVYTDGTTEKGGGGERGKGRGTKSGLRTVVGGGCPELVPRVVVGKHEDVVGEIILSSRLSSNLA